LKQTAGDKFDVESAGLEPGKLNPMVVEVMKEAGIDISQNKTKSVFDFFKQGKQYDYVVTVCDESQAGKCPFFPEQQLQKGCIGVLLIHRFSPARGKISSLKPGKLETRLKPR